MEKKKIFKPLSEDCEKAMVEIKEKHKKMKI